MTRAKASDLSERELLESHAKALEAQVEGLRAEVERLRAALELACPEDPFDGGDLPCRFCGIDPGSTHKSNCMWILAREALRGAAERADAPR